MKDVTETIKSPDNSIFAIYIDIIKYIIQQLRLALSKKAYFAVDI